MRHPYDSSPQRDNFYGAIGLLVVTAFACALLGSFFGFIILCALIGVVWTRAQWARIVTLVVVAYVGLVGLLVSLFARGQSSFAGFVAALIAAAIFWLLLRPGMHEYFSGSAPRPTSYVVPVVPRPGALPHLQQHQATVPFTPGVGRPSTTAPGPGSTQEQWARLQQQLRAEQEKEEREAAAESKHYPATRERFPWIIAVLAAFMCSYVWSIGGELSKFIVLLVVPGCIAALARWVPWRAFFLAVLLLTGGLILVTQWTFVAPQMQYILQHHGSGVLAGLILVAYLVAICYSGLPGACESAA